MTLLTERAYLLSLEEQQSISILRLLRGRGASSELRLERRCMVLGDQVWRFRSADSLRSYRKAVQLAQDHTALLWHLGYEIQWLGRRLVPFGWNGSPFFGWVEAPADLVGCYASSLAPVLDQHGFTEALPGRFVRTVGPIESTIQLRLFGVGEEPQQGLVCGLGCWVKCLDTGKQLAATPERVAAKREHSKCVLASREAIAAQAVSRAISLEVHLLPFLDGLSSAEAWSAGLLRFEVPASPRSPAAGSTKAGDFVRLPGGTVVWRAAAINDSGIHITRRGAEMVIPVHLAVPVPLAEGQRKWVADRKEPLHLRPYRKKEPAGPTLAKELMTAAGRRWECSLSRPKWGPLAMRRVYALARSEGTAEAHWPVGFDTLDAIASGLRFLDIFVGTSGAGARLVTTETPQ